MIEEIVRPHFELFIALLFSIIPVGLLITKFSKIDDDFSLLLFLIVSVIISITGFVFVEYANSEWIDSVKEQVLSLDCSQYEEAYEMYKYSFIKEEYVKNCTETVLEWWGDA